MTDVSPLTARTSRSTWLAFGLLGALIATLTWQHALRGLPVRGSASADNSRAVLPAPASEPHAHPPRVLIAVPFTPQAPFGNWSAPYAGACEEASVAMAMAWVHGDPPGDELIPPARANAEIRELVNVQEYYFGYSYDTALRETAKIITRAYGYPRAAVRYDIDTDDIRAELAAGNIVIVPIAGAALSNPSYVGPPPYHMLLIRGYDDATGEFITNDPGTRSGAGYRYRYEALFNAIHDWTGSEATILNGRKGMIVVAPPDTRPAIGARLP